MPAYRLRDECGLSPDAYMEGFLIQFLNIAGLGPIFGAIMGVMFGQAAFLWIVLGTIFGGAVHDFMSGVMSIRMTATRCPSLWAVNLGPVVKQVMRVLSLCCLCFVAAVFVVTPTGLLAGLTPSWAHSVFWIAVISATTCWPTLACRQLIGRFYPVFGFALLFMAGGLMWCSCSVISAYPYRRFRRRPSAMRMPDTEHHR